MSAEADATPGFGALPTERPRRVSIAPLVPDELLAAARAGDESAFAELYRAVHPRLLRYLRVLAHDEAEDIAAETWLQVCRDLAGFGGNGQGFVAWLVKVARNRAIDHFRHGSRRPSVPVPVEQFIPIAGPDDTESQALSSLSTTAAVALIASLPTDQAEAVMLRTVIGLDAKAAGQVLGKRPGAVRVAAHRGLKSLGERAGDAR
ncbi:MAG TPA: RNA polymerase sigma factor [Jatrophihabitans sp.]|nr:RNA polymerase sigma factor [Jatrophihabitans sp.]